MTPRKRSPIKVDAIGSPFLTRVRIKQDRVIEGEHPFTLPILANGLSLEFTTPVTFLVGENGSGKSSVLEALAWATGFGLQGGSRDHQFAEDSEGSALGRALALSWSQRVSDGFFLRAETFHQFSTHLEEAGSQFFRYGGKSLHLRSHGEAFLALFEHRFEEGIYLLDEPEAALSPQRQLAFMAIMHSLAKRRIAQFIVATHSPILLCLPGARVLGFEDGVIGETDYQDTEHFRLTREFLLDPARYLRHLLADEDEDAETDPAI